VVSSSLLASGTKRKTNHGRFWYVPLSKGDTVQAVPLMTYDDPDKEVSGKLAYEEQKAEREKNSHLVSATAIDEYRPGLKS